MVLMNLVEPIRIKKKIDDLKKYLIGAGNVRNYTLIVMGLNSALRISDILSLKWKDLYDFNCSIFKTYVYLIEKKNSKAKKMLLNKPIVEALTKLKESQKEIKPDDYVFMSRQGVNKPLTRFMALKIIKESCSAVGIKEVIGCHSLRKTFGYHSWKKGVPIPMLMELYNHSDQATTKIYLGICQDDIDEVYRLIEL